MFAICWSLYGASYLDLCNFSFEWHFSCVLYFSDSQPGAPCTPGDTPAVASGYFKREVAVSLCVHVPHMHMCVCECGRMKSCGRDYEPTAPAAELKQVVDLERHRSAPVHLSLLGRRDYMCWNYTAVQVQVPLVENP